MVYTIVALPQDDQLHKLNTIRNYFYQNGFRQRVSKCKENAHITLLQLKDSLSKNFWSEVESSLINTRKINLTNFQIILQEHDRIKKNPERNKKYPEWCGRFALFFPKNQNLIHTAKKIRKIAENFDVDDSLAYAQNIANTTWEYRDQQDIFNYLANHMNLCNYIRLDKMHLAATYFKQHFNTQSLIIDKIALADDKGQLVNISYLEK